MAQRFVPRETLPPPHTRAHTGFHSHLNWHRPIGFAIASAAPRARETKMKTAASQPPFPPGLVGKKENLLRPASVNYTKNRRALG
jgi:hypothetical protein